MHNVPTPAYLQVSSESGVVSLDDNLYVHHMRLYIPTVLFSNRTKVWNGIPNLILGLIYRRFSSKLQQLKS